MRIRLHDTPAAVEAVAKVLRGAFDVLAESGDYTDRPPSQLVRRYLDVTLRPEAPASAVADTTHYAHAMTGAGAETPRCGAVGTVALFAYSVTCTPCLALLADQTDADAWDVPRARTEAGDGTACRYCRIPFDPADKSFDGHGRHADSPWCRSCVGSCHSSEIADHRCPVCEA